MKKPTDSYGKAASQEAVRQRLAELERGAIKATPQQMEAVAILIDNCSRQLRALGQSIVRPDLDPADQLPTARNACKLARESLDQLLKMLPAEGRK